MLHNFIPPDRFFPYLSWTDIQTMPNKENVVIIQPIGAIEQHGPHLPIVVDAAISMAILGNTLNQLEPTIPAYALPCLSYGKSNEHWHFPGTITLSAQTLLAVLMDVAESLYRAGFRKLVFMNSHGGQPQVLEIAARDLHQKYDDFAVFPLFTWSVPTVAPVAQSLFTPQELSLGIHAGALETSLMLAILPNQVQMGRAIAEYPAGEPRSGLLSMEGPLPFAWMTRDLSQTGTIGDPTTATAAKGEQLLAALTAGWQQVITEVYQFQLPHPN